MAKKIGASKTRPTSDARPLGTPAQKRAQSAKKVDDAPKALDSSVSAPADSQNNAPTLNDSAPAPVNPAQKEQPIMATLALTLDTKARKSSMIVFKVTGLNASARISKSAFPDGVAPSELTLQSDNDNAFAQPKKKLTAEERKALRAALPKKTAAQKLADLQARADKLAKKIAAQAAAVQAAPPVGDQPAAGDQPSL